MGVVVSQYLEERKYVSYYDVAGKEIVYRFVLILTVVV